jgi:MFS family permease
MTEQTKKKIGMIGIVALMLSNFAYMSDLVIIPAYAAIFGHFATASELVTNFIASGSQLALIVGCLLSPILMKYLPKKTIIVISFALFTLASSCSAVIDDAGFVALMTGFRGLFTGLVYPAAAALIVELFRDNDRLRTKYMGWFDGSMAGIGAIALIISGLLLTWGWNAIFFEYLLGIPIWVLLLLFLPLTPADKDQDFAAEDKAAATAADAEGQTKETAAPKVFVLKTAVAIFFAFAAINMFYGALVYEFSVYLAENYADLPPFMNGLLGAIKGVLGAVCGFFVFAPLFRKAKRFTNAICFCAQAVAFFGLLIVFQDMNIGIAWFLLCYAFIGIAFGLAVPYYYSYVGSFFPREKTSLMMSVLSVAFSLGAFLSTYFVTFLQSVLNIQSYTPVMPIVGAFCLCGAVLAVIVGLRDPNRKLDWGGGH